MTANAGREVDFEWDGATVLGIREKSAALNGEPINVTSDEDSGWQTLLTIAGENKVEISISGVSKDVRLKTAWFTGDRTNTVTLTYPNGDILTGTFYLASFKQGMPYKDAMTFEAALQSSGEVTFTPYA